MGQRGRISRASSIPAGTPSGSTRTWRYAAGAAGRAGEAASRDRRDGLKLLVVAFPHPDARFCMALPCGRAGVFCWGLRCISGRAGRSPRVPVPGSAAGAGRRSRRAWRACPGSPASPPAPRDGAGRSPAGRIISRDSARSAFLDTRPLMTTAENSWRT